MKKYIILLVVMLFSVTSVWAPPPPGEGCFCCDHLIDPDTGEPYIGDEAEYLACAQTCEDNIALGLEPCPAPIDSGILILLILATSLGIYKVYQNKKRQFEN